MENTKSTDLELSSSQSWIISGGDQTNLVHNGNMTIHARIKAESNPTGAGMSIVSRQSERGSYSFAVNANNGGAHSKQLYAIISSAIPGSDSTVIDGWSAGTIEAGTWYDVTLVIKPSTQELLFYINGSLSTTTYNRRNGSGIATDSVTFAIGQSGGGNNDAYFDGLINDVRIWLRGLDSTEVSDLNTDPCNFDNGSNLSGWWFIDDTLDSGKAHDNSSNNNDLTNENSATFSTDIPYTCTVPDVYHITGKVFKGAEEIEGATIICIKQSDYSIVGTTLSDENGDYEFTDLEETELYHLCVEFEDETQQYNALSYWNVEPVIIEV